MKSFQYILDMLVVIFFCTMLVLIHMDFKHMCVALDTSAVNMDRAVKALNESNHISVGIEKGVPVQPGQEFNPDPAKQF